jgi:hypothetical protein
MSDDGTGVDSSWPSARSRQMGADTRFLLESRWPTASPDPGETRVLHHATVADIHAKMSVAGPHQKVAVNFYEWTSVDVKKPIFIVFFGYF